MTEFGGEGPRNSGDTETLGVSGMFCGSRWGAAERSLFLIRLNSDNTDMNRHGFHPPPHFPTPDNILPSSS